MYCGAATIAGPSCVLLVSGTVARYSAALVFQAVDLP